jgi:hypothetical protein
MGERVTSRKLNYTSEYVESNPANDTGWTVRVQVICKRTEHVRQIGLAILILLRGPDSDEY